MRVRDLLEVPALLEEFPMAHKPTAEQEAIIAAYGTGKNLVIEAGAGAGKTSTLKMLAGTTPGRRGLYVAYNKAIATDAATSFPADVTCKTAHSIAYASVGKRYRARLNGPRVPAQQAAKILGIYEPVTLGSDAPMLAPQQMARLALSTVDRFCYSADTEINRWHVPRVNGLDEPAVHAALAKVLVPLAQRAWEELSRTEGKLRFTHDMYLKMFALTDPQLPADYVLLDEAQDSNPCVAAMVNAQVGSQLILVGDRCQPPGTMVTVVRGAHSTSKVSPTRTTVEQVPIEQIQPGDRVVSYNLEKSYLRRGGSVVSGVTVRQHVGSLITVRTADGLSSRYTPDHHCVVRFGAEMMGKHVVYLMRRGGDYRIGITSARVTSQAKRLGVVIRASQEGADATWILSVHNTRAEAAVAEMITAWTYGVPTLTFKTGNNNVMPQDDLDLFWAKLGGNASGASAALTAHGRSIQYPLWRRGERNLQTRRPTVMRACNLVDGMEMLPLGNAMVVGRDRASAQYWAPITVGHEAYAGPVYSMTVEGDHTYVGDGIVTHNCQAIYAWRGARDAMTNFNGQRLTLSQSFRFGQAVADEANKWLEVLDAPLRLTGYDAIPSTLGNLDRPDAVLCRSNARAVEEVMNAHDAGRRAALVGGGDDIRRMAEAALDLQAGRPTSHPELFAFATWGQVQEYVQDDGGSDLKVFVNLIDKYGAGQVISIVGRLVDERYADVIVSTAHRAKGREWKRVRIADDFREPKPTQNDPNPQIPREDAMLAYVAVTRAQHVLDRGGLSWVDNWVTPEAGDPPRPTAEAVPPVVSAAPVGQPTHCYRCGGFGAGCSCDPEVAAQWSGRTGQPAGGGKPVPVHA